MSGYKCDRQDDSYRPGWLADWLVGWLAGWLAGRLAGLGLAGWLADWLPGCLAGWLARLGWLAGCHWLPMAYSWPNYGLIYGLIYGLYMFSLWPNPFSLDLSKRVMILSF